ncbi:uncharacterized protein LOC134823067 [Bolinopsis microptera]|uniref:uncharacterized protein LOC134823067 n=1 Tax=Bolinopsis microptera TaxID=2820187 RepID=UPI00307AA18E
MLAELLLLIAVQSIWASDQSWVKVEQGVEFEHNLDVAPIEIKSNEESVTTSEQKYLWLQGKVGDIVNGFSTAILVPNYHLWLGNCNNNNKAVFNPPPQGNEIIWTIFKTKTKMVIECNGVFCNEYTYNSESVSDDARCKVSTKPTDTLHFVKFDAQVATEYRITDWRAPTLEKNIEHDIETTPLQIRTWADNDGSQLWIKFLNAQSKFVFSMNFKFDNVYNVWISANCNNGNDATLMKNVPTDHYKTWIVYKSSTEMKIECNDVEVWSIVYSSISQGCHNQLSKDSSKLFFNEVNNRDPPSPTIFYRPSEICQSPTIDNAVITPRFPSTRGKIITIKCESGYELRGPAHFTCETGNVWEPSDYNASTCDACPAGEYRDTSVTICKTCPVNTVSKTEGASECEPCEVGTVANADRTNCDACPAGEYRDTSMKICKTCPVNTVSKTEGASECESCEVGTVANADRTNCDACPAGEYRDTSMKICKTCPVNTVSKTEGASECESCEVGTVANADRTNCDACPAGEYRDTRVTICKTCPVNTVSKTEGASECEPCEVGTVANADRTNCDACPAGKYRDTSVTICKTCPVNTVSKTEGASECELCEVGTVANADRTNCDACPAGEYRDTSMTICKTCPVNTVSKTEGASECESCEVGTVSNSDKTSCDSLMQDWKIIIAEM